MKGGDIGNETPPRVYVVFEGTIAAPPKKPLLRKRRLQDWEPVPEVTQKMWDLWSRMNVRFDAVTFDYQGDDVQRWMDDHNVCVTSTWAFVDPQELAREMAYMPWVSCVVDHTNPLAYGGRGLNIHGVR